MAAKPMLSLRIPDDVRRSAADRARAEGRSLTDVVTQMLESYAAGEPSGPSPAAAQVRLAVTAAIRSVVQAEVARTWRSALAGLRIEVSPSGDVTAEFPEG